MFKNADASFYVISALCKTITTARIPIVLTIYIIATSKVSNKTTWCSKTSYSPFNNIKVITVYTWPLVYCQVLVATPIINVNEDVSDGSVGI